MAGTWQLGAARLANSTVRSFVPTMRKKQTFAGGAHEQVSSLPKALRLDPQHQVSVGNHKGGNAVAVGDANPEQWSVA
jgi:hypothetical protein